MKKLLSILLVVIMALVSLFSFACKDPVDPNNPNEGVNPPVETPGEGEGPQDPQEPVPPVDENVGSDIFTQVAPIEGAKVSLVKDFVQEWIDDYRDRSYCTNETIEYYNRSNKEFYGAIEGVDDDFHPVPVSISFDCTDTTATKFIVQLATDKNFTKNKVEIETTETSIEVENLFVNKTYYWKVTAKFDSKQDEISKIYSFTTKKGIRTIEIEGVSNSRDLGGGLSRGTKINSLIGSGDKQIKQGLIYRSAALDGITSVGRDTLVNVLGVKTQIDLRRSSESANQKAINGIKHIKVDTDGGVSILAAGNLSWTYQNNSKVNTILKKEIDHFANLSNYPIIFNCSAGRDRTGCLAFLIKGLCGAEKVDLFRDYEFGCFSWMGSNWGDAREGTGQAEAIFNCVVTAYNHIWYNYEGNYFADKVYNFLLDMGISSTTLDSIITQMVELV